MRGRGMRIRLRDGSCKSGGQTRRGPIPLSGKPESGRRRMDGTGPRAQVGACLRKVKTGA